MTHIIWVIIMFWSESPKRRRTLHNYSSRAILWGTYCNFYNFIMNLNWSWIKISIFSEKIQCNEKFQIYCISANSKRCEKDSRGSYYDKCICKTGWKGGDCSIQEWNIFNQNQTAKFIYLSKHSKLFFQVQMQINSTLCMIFMIFSWFSEIFKIHENYTHTCYMCYTYR